MLTRTLLSNKMMEFVKSVGNFNTGHVRKWSD